MAAAKDRWAGAVWLGGLALVVIVFGLIGAAVVGVFRQDDSEKFCAGVGLVSEDSAPTARAALEQYLAANRNQPSSAKWEVEANEALERGKVISFRNTVRTDDGKHGYQSISVSQGFDHERAVAWYIDGACV